MGRKRVRAAVVLLIGAGLVAVAIYFLLRPAGGEKPVVEGEPGGVETVETGRELFEFDETAPVRAEDFSPESLQASLATHRALPDNLFLPALPTDPDRARLAARDRRLGEMRSLHFKIEKNQATAAEREAYFSFRARYNRDKIAMLEYVALKTPGAKGLDSLPPHIQEMIQELESEIADFERKR